MSALQLWLLALGLLVLVGLAGHGAWQTRRSRPRRAQRAPRTAATGLPEGAASAVPAPEAAPRREPGFDRAAAGPAAEEPRWDAVPAPGLPAVGPSPGLALDLLSGAEAAPAPAAAGPAAALDEPSFAVPGEASPAAAAQPEAAPEREPELLTLPTRRREGPRIDLRIDCPATLSLDPPLGGEALIAHLPASRRVGSKLLLVEARPHRAPAASAPAAPAPADTAHPLAPEAAAPAPQAGPEALQAPASAPWDEAPPAAEPPPAAQAEVPPASPAAPPVEEAPWELPRPGVAYAGLRLAVQLASRSGALNEIEFSEFAQKVEGLADTLQARFELPDMREAVERARSLDAFAGAHDALLTLQLRARRAAWTPGFVQQQARGLGLMHGVLPGRMVLPAAEAGAPPQLVLMMDAQAALSDEPERAAVRELTLSLDVPQTPQQLQPFEAWVRLAGQLAEALEADICDDAGQPIAPQAFDAIRGSLAQLYADLDAADLPAGSPAARRLFA